MNRLTILVITILALTAVTAGVAFAVSGTGHAALPFAGSKGGQVAPLATKTDVVFTPAVPVVPVANSSAAVPVVPVAKPAAAKSAAPVGKKKAAKTITGAVVHDPDDCGDTCSDSKLDADDCGVDHCSDDAKSGKAAPASTIDDDGDGDGGDCGDPAGD
jgi:hypothetical protein